MSVTTMGTGDWRIDGTSTARMATIETAVWILHPLVAGLRAGGVFLTTGVLSAQGT